MARSGSSSAVRAWIHTALFFVLVAGFALSCASAALAATTISGVVTSKQTGLPIEGATVSAMRLLPNTTGWSGGGTAKTGNDGSYSVSLNYGAGTYRLVFSDSQGRFSAQWYGDVPTLGDATNVVVTTGQNLQGVNQTLEEPAGSIVGTLTDSVTGAPVQAGAAAYARAPSGTWLSVYGVTATCDTLGALKLVGLPAGIYRIMLTPTSNTSGVTLPSVYYSAEGAGKAPTNVRVLPGERVTGLDMAFPPAEESINVRAVDAATGDPIANAKVVCYSRIGGAELAVRTAFCSAEGTAAIAHLMAGEYRLEYSTPVLPYGQDSILASTGSSDVVEMRLRASGTISGTVRDQITGEPTSAILVRAYEYVDGVATGYMLGTSSAADGSYTIKGLKASTYRMMATDSVHLYYTATTYPEGSGASCGLLGDSITVAEGAAAAGKDIPLVPGSHITGQITDAVTGEPAGLVSLRPYLWGDGQWISCGRADAASRPDGSFDIPGMHPGTYRLRFYDSRGRYSDTYYAAGASASNIGSGTDITVEPAGTTSGIAGRIGAPAAGEASATMSVDTTGGPGSVTLSSDAMQTDGLTVAFDDAGLGGRVAVWPMDMVDTPAPEGVDVIGSVVDINTTALFDGYIYITMPYDESAIVGPESDVKMYHYADGAWVDITVSVDTVNNTVTGRTTSLSPIAQVAPPAARLTYVAGSGGTISGAAAQAVSVGRSGTPVTAVAAKGYRFTAWSDGLKAANRSDTATADATYTAMFERIPAKTSLSIAASHRWVRRSRAVTITGALSPHVATGTHVTLYIRKLGSSQWVRLATRHTDRVGHYHCSWHPAKKGTWYVQARYAGSTTYAASVSASKKVTVR